MRWLALLALALLALARGGLAPAAERVRYCDYPVYPPVSWSDGHEVRGLSPQVVKRVLGGLGYDVQVVVLGNWKRCLMDAAAGRVDVVLAYRTAQRDQGLAFAEAPVLREEVALFYNRRKPVRFQTLDDLSRYRGGLLFGARLQGRRHAFPTSARQLEALFSGQLICEFSHFLIRVRHGLILAPFQFRRDR